MATVLKSQVVNDVIVFDYSPNDYAKYLKAMADYEKAMASDGKEKKKPERPQLTNALEGLNILDVRISGEHKMTKSPIETGVEIVDCKVRMPYRISIKGICDNLRGEIKETKDTRSKFDSKVPIIGGAINSVANGVTDTIMGYEFGREQSILTRARSVYKKIHEMYTNREMVNWWPKLWAISTKGAVYKNMTLQSIEGLNDAEHLMVIPITLNFEELILPDDRTSSICLSDDDTPLSMSGSMKKGNIAERFMSGVKEVFS